MARAAGVLEVLEAMLEPLVMGSTVEVETKAMAAVDELAADTLVAEGKRHAFGGSGMSAHRRHSTRDAYPTACECSSGHSPGRWRRAHSTTEELATPLCPRAQAGPRTRPKCWACWVLAAASAEPKVVVVAVVFESVRMAGKRRGAEAEEAEV